jgi:hypothetical protein
VVDKIIRTVHSRDVQIRSEIDPNPIRSDRIRSDFWTKIFISDRIGLIKLFRSRIGSDWTSIFVGYHIRIKWINYPRIIARINYPCIYQSIIAVVAALFVWYFNWTSLCQLLDMYFSLLYLFGHRYFNLNEKFILLKNSVFGSDRIWILYQNSDRIRIRQFRIGF